MHVGELDCFDNGNGGRIQEKISKGRKALNASAGMGIRKCGISMAGCNLIFSMIAVPIMTFESELWCMAEKDRKISWRFRDTQAYRFRVNP